MSFRINPLLMCDAYKVGHPFLYPQGTEYVYSNLTARKSRISTINKTVFFGLQYFIKDYLIDKFQKDFFARPLEDVMAEYKSTIEPSLGALPTWEHIEALHNLGYLPITIKAVREGAYLPIGLPYLTIVNTHPNFYWVTNFIETIMSTYLWQGPTSATIAGEYYKILRGWADLTVGEDANIDFQAHDFSMRGMSSLESAMLSGAAHLLFFKGTDTIPAIKFAQHFYNAQGAVGFSVPATEHSVSSAGSSAGMRYHAVEEYLDETDGKWKIKKLLTESEFNLLA